MLSKITIAAIAFTGLVLAGTGAAFALEANDVAAAYADGYMGTDNQFHVWTSRSDAQEFRAKYPEKYHAWRHDDPRHK